MSHTCEYTRQFQRDKVKPGGILIKPEDARADMRDRILTDPKVGTYALLHAPHGGSQFHTRHFEYEFKKVPNKREPVKTGGVLIKPEDARADMRHSIHVDPRTHSTFAILKPALEAAKRRFSHEITLPTSSQIQMELGSSQQPRERFHTIEFAQRPERIDRRERVKTGGILIKPEDARADMRHNIHVDPRTHSTYALLKPYSQIQREHGAQQPREGERFHTIEFTQRPERIERRERVKTGGILIKPEDARPDMRHSLHIDPRTHASYALLKPWEERQHGHSGVMDTRSSLDDLNSQVDSIITRSRNILSQSHVMSVPSLGYMTEAGLA